MRRIKRCLNSRIIEICQRTVQLEELNTKLYGYLPSSLQEHCHVGSFNKGCLMIMVSDPVWASQLRYCVPDLRDKLRGEGGIYQLSSIKVTVASAEAPPLTKNSSKAPLSAKARETIIASSEECTYLPLKQALHHLAGDK